MFYNLTLLQVQFIYIYAQWAYYMKNSDDEFQSQLFSQHRCYNSTTVKTVPMLYIQFITWVDEYNGTR